MMMTRLRLLLSNICYDLSIRLLRRRGETLGYVRGDRTFVSFRLNSPGFGAPPICVLEVDSLNVGRVVRVVMSPGQFNQLATHMTDMIRDQTRLFGDAEPREYDTRHVEVE